MLHNHWQVFFYHLIEIHVGEGVRARVVTQKETIYCVTFFGPSSCYVFEVGKKSFDGIANDENYF